MNKVVLMSLCLLASIMGAKAQIGYQIALLNTATGEARANETVVVSVSLSNSANEVFYSETKSATTNDFGVLSLTIGNADTFKNVDLSEMPFFIEVTANGILIGKSQMLSVPVAEVAKKVAPIDKSSIVGTWYIRDEEHYRSVVDFSPNNTGTSYLEDNYGNTGWQRTNNDVTSFTYEISVDLIYTFRPDRGTVGVYVFLNGKLYRIC